MIWTFCNFGIAGTRDTLDLFEENNRLRDGGSFSLSREVPIGSLPTDKELEESWGCSGPIEVLRPWVRRTPTFGFVLFRSPGGPPSHWLTRVGLRYPTSTIWLRHATEATAVHGMISYSRSIRRVEEVEGDIVEVEARVAEMRG